MDPAAEAAALAAVRAKKAEEDFALARAERRATEEAEQVERERIAAERREQERIEAERLEAERVERERLEAERVERERVEQERIDRERAELEEAQRLAAEAEKAERSRQAAERNEQQGSGLGVRVEVGSPARSRGGSGIGSPKSDKEFPPSPLNIRDFDDLLHLYARDIGDSLEASGYMSFDVSEAQQLVALNSSDADRFDDPVDA
jgi:hypothetical protein